MTMLQRTRMKPPLQARSRGTLTRILEATEDLLRDHLLEEISLADILKRSGVSVGAFYGRFPSRESLIPCLYQRYDERLSRYFGRAIAEDRWRGRDLRDRVTVLFRYAVTLYRRNRGLMRALALRARTHPEIVTSEHRAHRSDQYAVMSRFLLECAREMTHTEPERAVRMGLLMAGATFREKILYDRAPHPQSVEVSDRILAREVSRAFLSYVGAKGAEG
jgi:AcrR family transcriptional regulator